MPLVPGYGPLKKVLDAAYDQSARGKGKERHANELPFEKQPIMEITRSVGIGFPLGQAQKKINESVGLRERGTTIMARTELLGAIVYLCAAVLMLDKEIKEMKND